MEIWSVFFLFVTHMVTWFRHWKIVYRLPLSMSLFLSFFVEKTKIVALVVPVTCLKLNATSSLIEDITRFSIFNKLFFLNNSTIYIFDEKLHRLFRDKKIDFIKIIMSVGSISD